MSNREREDYCFILLDAPDSHYYVLNYVLNSNTIKSTLIIVVILIHTYNDTDYGNTIYIKINITIRDILPSTNTISDNTKGIVSNQLLYIFVMHLQFEIYQLVMREILKIL